jgi:hypothetical protein
VAVVIGGSALAYVQWVGHRPLVILLGALLLLCVFLESAYRQWDGADRELGELRKQLSRTAIAPDHQGQFEALYQSFLISLANGHVCTFGGSGDLLEEAFRAHVPMLMKPLNDWNDAVAEVDAACGRMRGWIERETHERGCTAPIWEVRNIVASLYDFTVFRALRSESGEPHNQVALRCVKDRPDGGWTAYLNANSGEVQVRVFEDTETPNVQHEDGALNKLIDDIESGPAQEIVAGVATRDALLTDLRKEILLRRGVSIPIRPDCPICAHRLESGVV